ncbi:helix-turn-helix domain-containing protein [Vallitalea okinawensis]|uniref:helix-turn-helix domain-containing protein n=1 Tax=Vallitalea okinawensis TaxID=2078660 RepID=UPI000CFA99D3|nr:helix-turn-helix domain-containing protein [Vallitalea okinawensis]
MPKTIGEKIKELRKELKVTQSEVAGKDMTKSMLSQIENNIATPSMRSLKIIANKLNKPVAYFLEEERENLDGFSQESTMKRVKEINLIMDEFRYEEAKNALYDLLTNLSFTKNDKLCGDIHYKIGECLTHLNKYDDSEKEIDKAIEIYLKGQLYSDAAMAYMEKANRYINAFDYQSCTTIINEAVEIYQLSITKDYFFEINLIYLKTIICAGSGELNDALIHLKQAISLSKEKNIYYKCDHLYQTAASINLVLRNYDEFVYNIKKAEQFAQFTENKLSLAIIYINYAEYENLKNNPDRALNYLGNLKERQLRKDLYSFYVIEKAKALYLLEEYESALQLFEDIHYNNEGLLNFDYLFLWSAKIYHGLTLVKLDRNEEALIEMQIAIDKLEGFQYSVYHTFAYKSISNLYFNLREFESAYNYLKKANDIENSLDI